MVKLKLTLKSKKPSNVYALNGKAYRLQPGSNTLTLEYNDYLSLAKALGIKPVENPDAPKSAIKEAPKSEPVKAEPSKQEPVEEPVNVNEPEPVEEPAPMDATEPAAETPVEKADEQPIDEEPAHVDDSVVENEPAEDSKEVDYTSWSYNQLKAEYKRITGNTCKLKKVDVIQFLQEHDSNV